MDNNEKYSDTFIKKKITTFIINKFLLGDSSSSPSDDESFLERGIIDSTGVLELVNFIEETFSITVEDEELVPDNLDSLNKLTSYIIKKIGHVS